MQAFEKADQQALRSAAAADAAVSVWWWSTGPSPSPTPRLVTTAQPTTRRPQWRAMMHSGTVDMPTASAPSSFIIRTSAGVSKDGPG